MLLDRQSLESDNASDREQTTSQCKSKTQSELTLCLSKGARNNYIFGERDCLKRPYSKACWRENGRFLTCSGFPPIYKKTLQKVRGAHFLFILDRMVGLIKHNVKVRQCKNPFHVHFVGNLPSTTAKFLNPMASNRHLTISDNSGIYKKDKQDFSGRTMKWKKVASSLRCNICR